MFIAGKKMLKFIKEFIKTKPAVYDFFNAKRPIKDAAEIWMDTFSKSNHGKIRFIQIGASDGLRWDPVRRFILRDNWSGVLIEPLQPVYRMLKDNYAYLKREDLFFENCAISDQGGGSIGFWSYTDEFLSSLSLEDRLYYLRKSSLDKGQVERALAPIAPIGPIGGISQKIICYTVKVTSLRVIIDRYFPDHKIDLVCIDAEGHDDAVIRSIDFEECTPKAIFYESHNQPGNEAKTENYLIEKGYAITRLGGDTVAVLRP